jgi:hypothetical protein
MAASASSLSGAENPTATDRKERMTPTTQILFIAFSSWSVGLSHLASVSL